MTVLEKAKLSFAITSFTCALPSCLWYNFKRVVIVYQI